MTELKNQILRVIGQEAARKVSILSGQYIRAESGQKEVLQAALEIERWLAQSCRECCQSGGEASRQDHPCHSSI